MLLHSASLSLHGVRIQRVSNQPTLRRALSLPLLIFYGLGTILGAGIYVLVGEVAGVAGMLAPLAFLVAATIAGFTAFSYAELSSRIPQSAGEAAYLKEAFGMDFLAACAGWSVVAAGMVSAATVANGFVGYLQMLVPVPDGPVIVVSLLLMGGLAAWGVGESVIAAAVVTVIEIVGLLLVVALSGHHLASLPARLPELVPTLSWTSWSSILLGGYLAFFAFIGFEDMVNMAEEVREPRRNLPRAIIICLFSASFLYLLIALIAVLALPPEMLAGQKAPLAKILSERGVWASSGISLISMVAVINGALVQIIMAARVLYGMAGQGIAPRAFRAVHPRTQTPLTATIVVTVIVIVLALGFPLVSLAKATSTITLIVFALVNAALWRLKRGGEKVDGAVSYPLWVPIIGLVLCVGCLLVGLGQAVNK